MNDFPPLPWSVAYLQRDEQWDPRACPYIVDALGSKVLELPQFVGHPGEYDRRADGIATMIVAAVNALHAAQQPWVYEDDLPDDFEITTEMFAASKIVDGVRMYPIDALESDD